MLDEELPSKPFVGVRFALFGFHPADERKIRSKLVDGGGAEDSQYSRSSTHVIVDKIVWEDPVCVAARNDGKTLVTGLWVDHSYDIGMPVDASSIMYRPLRGLKGIPGANSLIVCLTGYQRQDRDDIMTMVGLMGAQFSKPLVANRVTHLICYKFEGEKYELAKKQKKIKLVNHRWLEDCLRDWELVPEDDYSKCGYDLEMLEAEAEAKDSEEETEETSKRSGSKSIQRSPHGSKAGTATFEEMSKVALEVSNAIEPAKLSNAKGKGISSSSSKLEGPYLASSFDSVAVPQDVSNKGANYVELPVQNESSPHSVINKDGVFLDPRFSVKSYSRKSQGQSPENCQMSVVSGKTSLHVSGSAEGMIAQDGSIAPPPNIQHSKDLFGFNFTESDQTEVPSGGSSFKGKGLHDEDVSPGLLPQKRMMDSVSSTKSQKMCRNLKAGASPVFGYGNPGLKNDLSSFMTEPSRIEHNEDADENSPLSYSKTLKQPTPCKLDAINSSLKNDLVSAVAESPKNDQNNTTDQRSPDTCLRALTESTAGGKLNLGKSSGTIKAGSAGKAGEMQIQHFDVTSTGGKSPMETSHSPPNRTLLDGGCSRLGEKPFAKKTFGRRNLGSITKRKDSTFSENIACHDNNVISLSSRTEKVASEGAICSGDGGKRLTHDTSSKLEMSPKTSSEFGKEKVMTKEGKISLEGGVDKSVFNDYETEPPDEKTEDDHLKTYDCDKLDLPEVAEKPDNVEMNHVIGDLGGGLADKPFAKKTLGRRANLSSNAKKKNSTCSDKVASPDRAVHKSGKTKKMTSKGAFCSGSDGQELTHGSFSKLKVSAQTISKVAKEKEIVGQGNISVNDGADKAGFLDTDTESPNENPEDAYLKTYDGGKPNLSAVAHKADNQEMNHVNCGSDGNEHMNIIAAGNAGDTESKKVASSSKEKTMKGMGGKMKKQVLRKPKTKTANVALKRDGDKLANGSRKFEEEGNGKENFAPDVEKNDNNASISKSRGSMKVEKKPVEIDQESSLSETVVGSTEELKPNGKSSKSTKRSKKTNSYLVPVKAVASRAKAEPSCFIVSGHRLQRKEFQKVIRDLKGRCCRDSHQWSYQATHFIAPDPIRRTEKFFAAAASGRWILKTDYLSACSKEGKFLPEEPYEWHKNGLSEDGAINLEAPQKWRLLREKTGHGALYGMRIIIYGECIAPPLETLKRVVKAGDGTILATSPPYTKLLNSGVDFAIVSPGMPHVDLWVQEFLKHEIPCVLADYLVDYVCKPGYPLEKHVLHKTNAWAEKSFANLTRRSEEVVEVATPVEDCGSDDISCQVCGSRDRGDVMLICGDESGSTGCGIGVHTDCCEPPLLDIPSGDWFCSNCSTSRKSPTPVKKRRSGQSSTKNK